MSVIGRLDEQVNRLLIEPLAEGTKADAEDAAKPTPPDIPPASVARESQQDRSPDGRRELPVWLL